jgi:hypothetical protein
VPEFTYRALMHAKSKGQFFQTSIDGKFKFEEVKWSAESHSDPRTTRD